MPEEKPVSTVPESAIVAKKHSHFSLVWIVPVVAALAAVWIGLTTIRNQGPKVTIAFKSAEGLEAGKTKIRFNGVQVGLITAIRLGDDLESAIATAEMGPHTEKLLVKDTKFWVVRPQISGATISGLNTLISGDYIGMQRGVSQDTARHFTGLEDAPLEGGDVRGRFFTLKTPELGSLQRGTPIYYRRLRAGQIASYELDKEGKFLNVKVFVREPYDQFITADTRFWHASGVEMSLSTSGLKVQTESLLSILIGGVAFETPTDKTASPPAEENSLFALFKDRDEAFRPPPNDPQKYVLEFKQSVRGLAVGAPVEFGGISIGEVTDMQAQFSAKTYEHSEAVTIEIDPMRFGVKLIDLPPGETSISDQKKLVDTLVARGMRAQLKSASLITGARFVSLDIFPDAPPVVLDWSQNPVRVPTASGQLESLEENLGSIVKKVNQMPFKDIGDNLNQTLIDARGTIVGARGTLTNADNLLVTANHFIAPDSAFDAELGSMLQHVGGAAQAIRLLADYLERHPEALIRGKTEESRK
jgi:paraquat-inducible protein B